MVKYNHYGAVGWRGWAKRASDGKLIRPRLYRVWSSMRNRCRNPNSQKWHRYGGRGIKICSEWGDYAVFREWAIGTGYRKGLTIDRINNDGNYEPDNCRWVTKSVNSSKLTPADVRAIRVATGTTTEIGDRFGVDCSHISRIRNRLVRANVID